MKRTISIIPLLVLIIATACHAASSEQKQYAFDAIERNAEPIAVVGDSLYYFGELGMQEFESARFLKQTLEEERAADRKLTTIAESEVNLKAA